MGSRDLSISDNQAKSGHRAGAWSTRWRPPRHRVSELLAARPPENREAQLGHQTWDSPDAVAVEVAHFLRKLVPRHEVRRAFARYIATGSEAPALPEPVFDPAEVLHTRKHLNLVWFELHRPVSAFLDGHRLATDGREFAGNVDRLIPARRSERFVQFLPAAEGGIVVR